MLLLHLSPGCAASLAPHRTRQGWEAAEGADGLWLRCPETPASRQATAALPCFGRYRQDAGGGLIPDRGTLPSAPAPAGPWQPLREYLAIKPLPARLPGRTAAAVPLALERSSREVPAEALLVSLTALKAWAEGASRLRLARLAFAAAADGRALVTGTPLPPVPGQACYRDDGLVLPCGWSLAAPLRAAWVRQALAPAPGALVLIDPQAHVEIISQEAFVPLTLAALRRTAGALP
jgi:hypothetical protein